LRLRHCDDPDGSLSARFEEAHIVEVVVMAEAGNKMLPRREHLFQTFGPFTLSPLPVSPEAVGSISRSVLGDEPAEMAGVAFRC
jgi:hypothetical protein